ncbi:MAG: RluA family pseudouridine synthase [Clostridia bacterium]|nr:RluA family pseudouridine synthase [Clostridia bacterium]
MRLDKYLSQQYPDVTRSQIIVAIKRGDFTVNGKTVKAGYELRESDTVEGQLSPVVTTAEPEDIPLNIVYEDDDLLVINKPRGMVVHPGAGVKTGTVLNALLGRGQENLERAGIVHRLDKNTAGLLIVAKTADCQQRLGKMFEKHSIKRTYWGLVDGVVPVDQVIDRNIKRHPQHRTIFTVTDQGGRRAITHLHVLERYARHTLCEFTLETGRTHQIRVHCKSIHHPIVGDPEYNSGNGQMLEALKLDFIHPITGEAIHLQIQPTKAFAETREKCYNLR